MNGEPVGVIRASIVEDRYGDSTIVYDDTVSHTVEHCAFDPGGTSEVLDGRTAVVTRPTLYMPPGADIEPSDRVRIRGRVYDVGGEPAVWRSPFDGLTKGVVVPLGEVIG